MMGEEPNEEKDENLSYNHVDNTCGCIVMLRHPDTDEAKEMIEILRNKEWV